MLFFSTSISELEKTISKRFPTFTPEEQAKLKRNYLLLIKSTNRSITGDGNTAGISSMIKLNPTIIHFNFLDCAATCIPEKNTSELHRIASIGYLGNMYCSEFQDDGRVCRTPVNGR